MKKIIFAKNTLPLEIKKIEKKYNAKYIGDFAINNSERAHAIFYVENPDTEKGHSNYFGIGCTYFYDYEKMVFKVDKVYITNAISLAEGEINGVQADNGQIVVSCFNHDYVTSDDGSAFMDGGFSGYFRYRGKTVKLKLLKNKLVVK